MNIDKMREEFEAWAVAGDNALVNEDLRFMESRATYYFATTRYMWEAWQASRAAIEVELPCEDNTRCYTVADEAKQEAYNQGLGECRYAIESLGLKVKTS